jgi:hypothetical protein
MPSGSLSCPKGQPWGNRSGRGGRKNRGVGPAGDAVDVGPEGRRERRAGCAAGSLGCAEQLGGALVVPDEGVCTGEACEGAGDGAGVAQFAGDREAPIPEGATRRGQIRRREQDVIDAKLAEIRRKTTWPVLTHPYRLPALRNGVAGARQSPAASRSTARMARSTGRAERQIDGRRVDQTRLWS